MVYDLFADVTWHENVHRAKKSAAINLASGGDNMLQPPTLKLWTW